MTEIVLALGSNLGNRRENLETAVQHVQKEVEISHLSSFLETTAFGGVTDLPFLNAVLIGTTELSARELLNFVLGIESHMGRIRESKWGARNIDIDLILFGESQIQEPDLVIPHPEAHLRGFVLRPWLEIDPSAQIPGRGQVADLILVAPY